jgi:wyosine [tRNA(Phe)-imidazoG37] synthetase (radical SAM superfamily)
MKYVFGPVPSRRLGQSLGIDTIPLKTCNWNCVYCQLGRTHPVTNERKDYFPPDDIVVELHQALDSHRSGEIDWVTFVGSGEPTLHASIGWLIRQAKSLTDLPIAVITNGSLLYLPEVRDALCAADAVMPTLDAGTPELYRRINRPHSEATFEHLLEGLIALRREYHGHLWLEVMLVKGLNDTDEALFGIAAALKQIRPDKVHLSLPTRPPAESWVQPTDQEGLMRARAILGDVAEVIHPAEGEFDLSGFDDVLDAIVAIITRHPMRQVELEHTLSHWTPGQVSEALTELETSGQAQVVERYGVRFWSAASSRYANESCTGMAAPQRHRHGAFSN